jgi:uncharacterized protein YwqG
MNWRKLIISVVVIGAIIALKASHRQRRATPPLPTKSYFQEGTNPTAEDVIRVYRELGYGTVADALRTRAAPCFRLISDKSPSKPLRSRIGGLPDLPEAGLWPKNKGKSLAFLAQVNLGELQGKALPNTLPADGMLYFFYEAQQSTWGSDPKDKGSWAVIYSEKLPDEAPSVAYPADLPAEGRYKSVPVRLQAGTSIPEPIQFVPDSLSDDQQTEIADVYEQFIEHAGSLHQLLGLPAPIQDNGMEFDCQLASHGIPADGKGYKDPRARSLKPGAKHWRLLLQLDSDDAAGMMWGDAGRLYFWILDNDLKDRHFENVWMVMQCY